MSLTQQHRRGPLSARCCQTSHTPHSTCCTHSCLDHVSSQMNWWRYGTQQAAQLLLPPSSTAAAATAPSSNSSLLFAATSSGAAAAASSATANSTALEAQRADAVALLLRLWGLAVSGLGDESVRATYAESVSAEPWPQGASRLCVDSRTCTAPQSRRRNLVVIRSVSRVNARCCCVCAHTEEANSTTVHALIKCGVSDRTLWACIALIQPTAQALPRGTTPART